jgi:hypothetical protein
MFHFTPGTFERCIVKCHSSTSKSFKVWEDTLEPLKHDLLPRLLQLLRSQSRLHTVHFKRIFKYNEFAKRIWRSLKQALNN